MSTDEWRDANRANWDERVAVNLKAYDLTSLRAGHGRLNSIEEAELGSVAGKRVLHLQCHFGNDTLALAQRGAEVVGLDFSPVAITTARELAAELGLSAHARFVQADLYDAPTGSRSRVHSTWFTSPGVRSAGCPMWRAGRISSRISSSLAAFFTMRRGIPLRWYSTTRPRAPTAVPSSSCRISTARR